jgi:hypothetical protein
MRFRSVASHINTVLLLQLQRTKHILGFQTDTKIKNSKHPKLNNKEKLRQYKKGNNKIPTNM